MTFFVRDSHKIIEVAAATERPFVFIISKAGELERINLNEIESAEAGRLTNTSDSGKSLVNQAVMKMKLHLMKRCE